MSALTDDELRPAMVGSTRSVPELLAALDVAGAPIERQRHAIRRAAELPGVASLVAHLHPELRRLGLL